MSARAVLAAGLFCMLSASGHRLDEYLQATRIAIDMDRVGLEIDLTPGVAVAPKVLAWIDTDGDGAISPAEGQAYARRVLGSMTLSVDNLPAAIVLDDARFPPPVDMSLGVGTIRLRATAKVPAAGAGQHRISFMNTHRPELSVYLVNALVPANARIRIGEQQRDRAQHGLTLDYTVAGDGPPVRAFLVVGGLFLAGRLLLLGWRAIPSS